MILDGVCYPVFSSVGSYYTYGVVHPYSVCFGEYLGTNSLAPERLQTSSVFSPEGPLLMIRFLHHLFKTLDLLSGEGVLTH